MAGFLSGLRSGSTSLPQRHHTINKETNMETIATNNSERMLRWEPAGDKMVMLVEKFDLIFNRRYQVWVRLDLKTHSRSSFMIELDEAERHFDKVLREQLIIEAAAALGI
jgi:hypothetical protein